MNTKKEKARQLRYKKPIAKDLNLDKIRSDLWDIQEACEEVHWYFDTDEDSLINALDGNEDEAYEFRMMFADLCAESERMHQDLSEEWIPECFDILFVVANAGDYYGGLLGYDAYEEDYFGLNCSDVFAKDEAYKKLMRMTKDDMIAAIRQCLKVYVSYIGLSNRYESLKAALDILRAENIGYLQMVRKIEELYEKAADVDFEDWTKETLDLDRFSKNLPHEAWLN